MVSKYRTLVKKLKKMRREDFAAFLSDEGNVEIRRALFGIEKPIVEKRARKLIKTPVSRKGKRCSKK